MRTENIISRDATTTEPAKNDGDALGFSAYLYARNAVTDLTRTQLLEMAGQRFTEFCSRLIAMFRLVFDSPNQQPFHLAGKGGG